jgi:hypothetical protein
MAEIGEGTTDEALMFVRLYPLSQYFEHSSCDRKM